MIWKKKILFILLAFGGITVADTDCEHPVNEVVFCTYLSLF